MKENNLKNQAIKMKKFFTEQELQKISQIFGDETIWGFDFETTGLDIKFDRIIQATFVNNFGDKESSYFLPLDYFGEMELRHLPEPYIYKSFKIPIMEITKDASYIHGQTNESLKNSEPFFMKCKKIYEFLLKSDYFVTYNGLNFDMPILENEFRGIEKIFNLKDTHFDLSKIKMLDVFKIFKIKEPQRFPKSIEELFTLYSIEEKFENAQLLKEAICIDYYGLENWQNLKNISLFMENLTRKKPMKLYYDLFSNSLENCFKFYTNENVGQLGNLHDSSVDVEATMIVFKKQLLKYNLTLEEYATICANETENDFSQYVVMKDDKLYFVFGNVKNKPVDENTKFVKWILTNNFSESFKNYLKNYLKSKNIEI